MDYTQNKRIAGLKHKKNQDKIPVTIQKPKPPKPENVFIGYKKRNATKKNKL